MFIYHFDGPIAEFFGILLIITSPYWVIKFFYVPFCKATIQAVKQIQKNKKHKKELSEFSAQREAEKAAKAEHSERNS